MFEAEVRPLRRARINCRGAFRLVGSELITLRIGHGKERCVVVALAFDAQGHTHRLNFEGGQ